MKSVLQYCKIRSQKEIDPDLFTIPILTKGKKLGRALCYLGSRINLMSLSIYQKLGIGEGR